MRNAISGACKLALAGALLWELFSSGPSGLVTLLLALAFTALQLGYVGWRAGWYRIVVPPRLRASGRFAAPTLIVVSGTIAMAWAGVLPAPFDLVVRALVVLAGTAAAIRLARPPRPVEDR